MDNNEVPITWKDWRIICPWCLREIEIVEWYNYSDMEWNGKLLKGNGIYWHGNCVQHRIYLNNQKETTNPSRNQSVKK